MKKRQSCIPTILYSMAMLALILDSRTALNGATEGLSICIKTVIPSLFPMMVLTSILTDRMAAAHSCVGTLGWLLGIPKGSEGLLAPGLLGGYPVGASCIASQYRKGNLSKKDADHLLTFCSNAGPSFIFGICGRLFTNPASVWLLWLIHMTSAFMVAMLPHHQPTTTQYQGHHSKTFSEAVKSATANMALICGWIILFRVIIQFLQKWLLCLMPATVGIGMSGILELTNGCFMLDQIPGETVRFVICSVLLSFGSICVLMQTSAVISPLSIRPYLAGKLAQTGCSFVLSSIVAFLLYSQSTSLVKLLLIAYVVIFLLFLGYFIKNTIAFFNKIRYNSMELCRKR